MLDIFIKNISKEIFPSPLQNKYFFPSNIWASLSFSDVVQLKQLALHHPVHVHPVHLPHLHLHPLHLWQLHDGPSQPKGGVVSCNIVTLNVFYLKHLTGSLLNFANLRFSNRVFLKIWKEEKHQVGRERKSPKHLQSELGTMGIIIASISYWISYLQYPTLYQLNRWY